ncbi:MAG: formate--tetrahydrofolate ligase, partial [Acidimicrobiales bacterium]
MGFPSDLEIAQQATLEPMEAIAERAGLAPEHLELHGTGAAKVSLDAIEAMSDRPRARYVVVSAITPTPLGEGKTTTTVGLGQAFQHIGRSATIAIRQPSMGPTFGIKGGAAGGGYSQVVPMELFNLHLTGDMHAVTAAHNLCSAMLDAHLYHGNACAIDLHAISWRRVLDVNDRALRNITIGLGGRLDGIPRETGFDITAASEVMAALALCTSLQDLRARLGRIVLGFTKGGTPVTADEIGAAGAMTVILRDAVRPNLMQTLEHTPALVHTGPFGNIATGNSSIVADQIGIHTGDFLLTEAGFGADMGAERFFNIKCRYSGMAPDAAVLVATVRGLKAHSGRHRIVAGAPLPEALLAENPDEVHLGGENLRKQLENIRIHGVTPVVAVNVFPDDHKADIDAISEIAAEQGVRAAVTTHFADGGKGAVELATAVAEAAEEHSEFTPLYRDDASLKEKIETIATKIYGAEGVDYSPRADKELAAYGLAGFGHLPVCIAKVPGSLTDDRLLAGTASVPA